MLPASGCTAPSGTAGLTVDANTPLNDLVSSSASYQCTSCPSGTRTFHTSTTSDTPSDSAANADASAEVECDDMSTFCACNSAGVCCTPASGASLGTAIVATYCDASGSKSLAEDVFFTNNHTNFV